MKEMPNLHTHTHSLVFIWGWSENETDDYIHQIRLNLVFSRHIICILVIYNYFGNDMLYIYNIIKRADFVKSLFLFI